MTPLVAPQAAASRELRFQFGKNWARFLSVLDEERIAEAERSLTDMLEMTDLRGRSWLDVGCGSGLFSLAAMRLGAARVHSFDYDLNSVACTRELKTRFFPNHNGWTIEQGSVLDTRYLQSLGAFDIVYSWGVLHHTGEMWKAVANVTELVTPDGCLFVAIYNDQGPASRRWHWIKRLYNRGGWLLRPTLIFVVGAYFTGRTVVGTLMSGGNPFSIPRWRDHNKRGRGMSGWHDLVDWVGGYPFEVAKPDEVFDFCQSRGFVLRRLKTVAGGIGNNQFVFVRNAD